MDRSILAREGDLGRAAAAILTAGGDRRVFTFTGEIGAGKTTLIRALCGQLGIPAQEVNSPTFSLINEYPTPAGTRVYHMDLYRLQSLEEALDIGIEDYLYSSAYCFIEWPELITPILPEDHMGIMLEIAGDSLRKILF